MYYLSRALKKNSTLKHLNVSYNEISVFGVDFLKEISLIKNVVNHLDTLNIGNNPLGNEGIRVLSDYLELGNSTIKHLDVSECKFFNIGAL